MVFALALLSDAKAQNSITGPVIVTNGVAGTDQVAWDYSLTFGGAELDEQFLDINFDGFACEFNIDTFPLRVHCNSKLIVGLADQIDVEMSIDMGAQIRQDQMNTLDDDPELDIYFAFESPDVSWNGNTYIDSQKFPSNGYYMQTIPLMLGASQFQTNPNGFHAEICGMDFSDYFPQDSSELEAVRIVLEALEQSGTDFCINVGVVKTGSTSVDLTLEGVLHALDDTKIDWNNFDANYPELANAYYTIINPLCLNWLDPSSWTGSCSTSKGAFEWLREKITGLDSGFVHRFNIADMIQEVVDGLEAPDAPAVKLVRSKNGAFQLGQEDPVAASSGEFFTRTTVAIIIAAGVAAMLTIAICICKLNKQPGQPEKSYSGQVPSPNNFDIGDVEFVETSRKAHRAGMPPRTTHGPAPYHTSGRSESSEWVSDDPVSGDGARRFPAPPPPRQY